MIIKNTTLDEVKIIKNEVYGDDRGFFFESFNLKKWNENGQSFNFVQDNHSRSKKGVIRGLHFQKKKPQGKLVRCVKGCVLDVAVNIDPKSKDFGKYFSIELSEDNKLQLWIPPGFAHGFCVLSDSADFCYKCTDYYDPKDESGIKWNDRDIGINWPEATAELSEKDQNLPTLKEYLELNK